MNKYKVFLLKLCTVTASCALALSVAITPAACALMFHQPKVPKGMSKFVKSKHNSVNSQEN
ncbi:MAG: cyclic lactone autoinducer peptide [Oscillospiraceae bacterium]|nr:cyclic lactone autoinducer peptide [Oscillospiraceae bacterium]